MAWRRAAETCRNGPCPTIYIDEETGSVRVQGTRVESHVGMPDFEGMLEFRPEEWRDLMRQMQEQSTG
jgi:hypothetical protein